MLNEKQKLSHLFTCVVLVVCSLLLVGCDRQGKVVSKQAIISELDVWVHTDNKEALLFLQDQVARFNTAHNRIRVTLISVPKGAYHAQINAAIRTGTLPDIIELDGPFLYNLAERGALIKLDKILTETTREDILPSVFQQGMYKGRVYSLATTTNSVVMYARKSVIQAAGFRIPAISKDAWNMREFEDMLELLMKNGNYSAAIDLGLNRQNEWLSRAIYPMLLSTGGGLINAQLPYASEGVLNSSNNIAALARIQRWINHGYVDKNIDDEAFVRSRVPFSWAGLEKYNAYKSKFGDDLVVIPLPDFGHGSRRVQRAWGWGLTQNCKDTQAAMRFLEFLFQPEEVVLAAKANAILPATYSALARFDVFNDTPSFSELIDDQRNGVMLSQLKSPLYPVISDAFQKAFIQIRNGAAIKSTLDTATKSIDEGRQKFESELVKSGEAAN